MELSKLQPYSIGIVAVNKKLDSPIIEVTPIEDAPMANGELTDNKANYKAQGSDERSAAYQVELQTTITVKATWLPIHSMNRKTAPDVRRGERVILYRFGDTDEYFWATLWDDLQLRKLETVVYAYSGTRVEGAEVNAENYYFFEVSTHAKVVHFHTSKADGEPFSYDLQINTKDGIITITDDAGNTYFLNSKERQQRMINADGSYVEINKQDITEECSGTITHKAKKIVQESTEHTISNTQMSMNTSGALGLSAGKFTGTGSTGELTIAGHSLTKHTHTQPHNSEETTPPHN